VEHPFAVPDAKVSGTFFRHRFRVEHRFGRKKVPDTFAHRAPITFKLAAKPARIDPG
jgi:hypothetical protein